MQEIIMVTQAIIVLWVVGLLFKDYCTKLKTDSLLNKKATFSSRLSKVQAAQVQAENMTRFAFFMSKNVQ